MSGWTSNSRGPRSRGVPEKIRRRIHRRDGHRCQQCGTRVAASAPVDHVVPVFEGGTDDPANLRTLCQPCHNEKTQAEAQRARNTPAARDRAAYARAARDRKRPPLRHPSAGLDAAGWEQWRQVMRGH